MEGFYDVTLVLLDEYDAVAITSTWTLELIDNPCTSTGIATS